MSNTFLIQMLDYVFIGIVGAFLGVFYRSCLKAPNMIFNWWYEILDRWVVKRQKEELEALMLKKSPKFSVWAILAWVAFPLGYCIYCSTTWITFFLCIIYLSAWSVLPCWQDIVIGVITASGVQHYIVATSCRYLIDGHPDLDSDG